MALPKITIKYLNGQLGTVPESQDGLLALAVTGATAAGETFALGTPYKIYRPQSLDQLGVTEENNPRLYSLVLQFYSQSGESTPLVIVGYPATDTMTGLCDKTTGKLRSLLQSQKGDIRGIVLASASEAEDGEEGLDADVLSALPKAQELADYSAGELYAPIFVALEGRGFTEAADLKDLSELGYNRCCVVIGGTSDDGDGAAMGIFAGKVASAPVQRNIGRVADRALTPETMYIGGKLVDECVDDITTIYDKGYICPRTYVGRVGYFFTDDRMACDPTDDYAHLTARRTIDKAARIAYSTLLDYMLGEIETNEDGTMPQGVIKSWQAEVESAIDTQMTAAGELSGMDGSGCRCHIDPSQNVVSTSEINITLKVRPYGYARFINVELGFLVESN